jgi:hypothetical protein
MGAVNTGTFADIWPKSRTPSDSSDAGAGPSEKTKAELCSSIFPDTMQMLLAVAIGLEPGQIASLDKELSHTVLRRGTGLRRSIGYQENIYAGRKQSLTRKRRL